MQLLWKQIFTHDPNEKIKTTQEIEILDSIRSPSEELKQDCVLASSGHGGVFWPLVVMEVFSGL